MSRPEVPKLSHRSALCLFGITVPCLFAALFMLVTQHAFAAFGEGVHYHAIPTWFRILPFPLWGAVAWWETRERLRAMESGRETMPPVWTFAAAMAAPGIWLALLAVDGAHPLIITIAGMFLAAPAGVAMVAGTLVITLGLAQLRLGWRPEWWLNLSAPAFGGWVALHVLGAF